MIGVLDPQARAISDRLLNALIAEFEAYCATHAIHPESADEMLHRDDLHHFLSPEERAYVLRFIGRWEAACDGGLIVECTAYRLLNNALQSAAVSARGDYIHPWDDVDFECLSRDEVVNCVRIELMLRGMLSTPLSSAPTPTASTILSDVRTVIRGWFDRHAH